MSTAADATSPEKHSTSSSSISWSSTSSSPPKNEPLYYNAALIQDILDTFEQEPVKSTLKIHFNEIDEALESAIKNLVLQKKDNNNNNTANQNDDGSAATNNINTATNSNNNTELPSPLLDVLLQFLDKKTLLGANESFGPLSFVAVAIIFIYSTEIAPTGAHPKVSSAVYPKDLRRLFKHELRVKLDVDDDWFTTELASSWKSILAPAFPSTTILFDAKVPQNTPPSAEATILAMRLADRMKQTADEVTTEYRQKIFPNNTLGWWLNNECNFGDNTRKAVNNFFTTLIKMRIHTINANLVMEGEMEGSTDAVKIEKIQQNKLFIQKIEDTKLPHDVVDRSYLEGIQTLEVWVEQRKYWIKRPDDVLKNKTLEFVASFFSSELSQLKNIWMRRVQDLITADSIKCLRPGSTPRFSCLPSYGIRSRHKQRNSVCDVLAGWDGSKEKSPLIGITSLCRQGKTCFLELLPTSPEFLGALEASFDPMSPESSNIVVLYITFNAVWNCTIETDDASVAENAAKHQISVRLLAAACGIHHGSLFARSSIHVPLENLLTVVNDPTSILDDVILPRIYELTKIPCDKVKLVLLMDEFSNLEPKTNNAVVSETCRKILYSTMADLIDHNSVVILSGFTPIPDLKTTSRRSVMQVDLPPFNSTESRQESLPMHSEFFRLLSAPTISAQQQAPVRGPSAVFYEPLAVHELTKGTAGIIGALLEQKRSMKESVHSAICIIPFLRTLQENRSTYWTYMSRMLQWKSVQVAAGQFVDDFLFDKEFRELLCVPTVQEVTHLPHGVTLDLSFPYLAQIRIDPMFLACAVHKSSDFSTFLRQLYNYSYHVRRDTADHKLLLDRFGSRFPQTTRGEKFGAASATFVNLIGSFYEDAVATGILFQTECRRKFLEKHPAVKEISFTLAGFLSDAQKIGSLWKEGETKTANEGAPAGRSVWSVFDSMGKLKNNNNNNKNDDDDKCEDSPTSLNPVDKIALVWSLPNNTNPSNDNNGEEGNDLPQHPSKSPGPSIIKYFGFDPCDRMYPKTNNESRNKKTLVPSIDTLHQPARGEKNELVDIVYHIPCAPDGNRLVEVWIDTKHSNSAPFRSKQRTDDGIFPSKEILGESLNNKLLRSPDSKVDHVVHIVISSYRAQLPVTENRPDVALGRLTSYTLYYVHPDSTAFENLVSQPIKEAIPLIEMQDEKNWTVKVPSNIKDWKYYRAAKRDIAPFIPSVDEFTRWRNICFDEDCSIPLGNLKHHVSEMLNNLKEQSKVRPEHLGLLSSVPLGCVIQSCGVRPFSIKTLQQQQYDEKLRVEVKSDGQIRFLRIVQTLLSTTASSEDFQTILTQVTVGHLMHHDDEFWRKLFDHDKRIAGILWSKNVLELPSLVGRELVRHNNATVVAAEPSPLAAVATEPSPSEVVATDLKTLRQVLVGDLKISLEGALQNLENLNILELKK